MAGLSEGATPCVATALRIDIWSDVICPWCYLGKRRLEHAFRELPDLDAEVHWHAFQLDPEAPRFGQPGAGMPIATLMAERGMGPDRIAEKQARVTGLAAAEGIAYRLDRARRVNTLEAHRLILSAADPGIAEDLVERLFQAQHVEGRRIDDPAVLEEIAGETGLGPDASRDAAAVGAALDEDRAIAHRLRIQGVPFFLLGERLALSGAQSVPTLVESLRAATRVDGPPA